MNTGPVPILSALPKSGGTIAEPRGEPTAVGGGPETAPRTCRSAARMGMWPEGAEDDTGGIGPGSVCSPPTRIISVAAQSGNVVLRLARSQARLYSGTVVLKSSTCS